MKRIDIRKTPIFSESWNIAWRKGYPGIILSDVETPFNIIENSFRYWAADPFVYERNGSTYIFAELYDYILCRGVLGYCKLDNTKKKKWIPIITERHHLSYPCIIEHENEIYLMPESSESKELILYKAICFPDKWEKKCILRKDECLADTTPVKWKDCKLAITHDIENPYRPKLKLIDLENKQDDIYIESAEALQSRPAGHTFRIETKHIRPAQFSTNGDEGYGKALLFYSYSIDDQLKYNEKLIKKLLPTELRYSKRIYIDGMHTYNANNQYEVIDIKTRRFNILNFVFRILNKIKKRK